MYRARPTAEPDDSLKRTEAARQEAEAARQEAEIARREAEAARSRLSFLSEASRALGSSLHYETTLRNLAELIVPAFGDMCVLDLVEEGEKIRRVALAAVSASRGDLSWGVARLDPFAADPLPSHASVLLAGESVWLPEIADEIHLPVQQGTAPEDVRAVTLRSFISVALSVHGQILGALSIARSRPGQSYTSADLTLAEEVARRAALAVDHARLYRASQEANRLKDEFLATLSHELRSPLSSALLCAQMLRRGILDAEKTARALETIERKIHLEVCLVDDLIDIARITAGKVSLERKRVDLAVVVGAAVEGARPAAEKRGVLLKFTPPDDAQWVHGDATRLQQVVDNLLANAIKFTPNGGSIGITVDQRGPEVRITVSDTGIGIPEDELGSVFERFRQLDTSLTRRYGGLGLGLAIVRNLTELHGGTVVAESAGPDRGSTFTVTLPRLPPSAYVAPPASIPARSSEIEMTDLQAVRVLVADDDEDAREAMATLLRSCGATVTSAASAREAIDALDHLEARQDVLISDISMPDMDGHALLRAIRARGSFDAAALPAIAVTAYASAIDRKAALNAGFELCLAKPVDQFKLVAAVAALSRRSSKTASRAS